MWLRKMRLKTRLWITFSFKGLSEKQELSKEGVYA